MVVDRFENGDPSNDSLDGIGPTPSDLTRHQGGDWRGLRQRLDYIARLGATAIWISPIVANVDRTDREDGYHGYWASDFTRLNPRFGDLAELRRLVNAAHDRGLKVIVDIVPNHSGRVFNYDLNRDGELDSATEIEPPYVEAGYDVPLLWNERPYLFGPSGAFELGPEHFRRRGEGDRVFGDFPTGLRDLDTEREDVIAGLIETYAYWVEQTDVDGFRIDAVPHIEDAFWPRFGSALRERLARQGKRRFFLIGEAFDGNPRDRVRFTGETGSLDSTFDFSLKFDVIDKVILEGRETELARAALEDNEALYRPFEHPNGIGINPWQARVGIVDNHDTWRLRGELDRFDSARLALIVLLTIDAIPCIYYGTEQELDGQGGAESRERMWDTGFRTDTPTYQLLRELIALRRSSPVLQRGDLTVRYTSIEDGLSEVEDAGILAYERQLDGDRALIVLNAHALKSSRAAIPTGHASGTTLRDELGAREMIVGEAGILDVSLNAREALILR